jgi:hypothetical protein
MYPIFIEKKTEKMEQIFSPYIVKNLFCPPPRFSGTEATPLPSSELKEIK